MGEFIKLEPIAHISGTINLPGSKSISNRALLLAALADGKTTITNLLDSDDVRYMLGALTQLGVNFSISEDKKTCVVEGMNGILTHNQTQALEIYLGNAGTAIRPLTAVLCLGSHPEIILTGEPRMKERPILHLVDSLKEGGASIEYLETHGYPPIKLTGGFEGGRIHVDGTISSQFLTALLMMTPLAKNKTIIKIKGELVSKPYIDITLHMMQTFGIHVQNNNYTEFVIEGNQRYVSPGKYLVEGDASSASYFLAAGAIKGGKVRVTGIGKNSVQGDTQFAAVLEKMGAKITWGDDYIESEVNDLEGIDMDLNHIPDAAMTIATTALFAKGPTKITNIYNWRVKETDRLFAMATELRKVGALVEEGEDFIHITPPNKFTIAEIDTYNDHRMAMCFSLVALSDTAVIINDPKCTSKTFPTYFEEFLKLAQFSNK
ncbi:3-phosphoshikimate 1-carboxyvinyltransferase [Thorsellia kenyensis]|uniref:3-phosphoshikimate 1-carboxyvinyltransferase n=1 Tax=Thorsellia kenyensis TaxID=1549888 RepID=A0ABV6CBP8_9GAMM